MRWFVSYWRRISDQYWQQHVKSNITNGAVFLFQRDLLHFIPSIVYRGRVELVCCGHFSELVFWLLCAFYGSFASKLQLPHLGGGIPTLIDFRFARKTNGECFCWVSEVVWIQWMSRYMTTWQGFLLYYNFIVCCFFNREMNFGNRIACSLLIIVKFLR